MRDIMRHLFGKSETVTGLLACGAFYGRRIASNLLVYCQLLTEPLVELARWTNSSVERLAFGAVICTVSAGWSFDVSGQLFEPHPYLYIWLGSILLTLAFVQVCGVVVQRDKPASAHIKQPC